MKISKKMFVGVAAALVASASYAQEVSAVDTSTSSDDSYSSDFSSDGSDSFDSFDDYSSSDPALSVGLKTGASARAYINTNGYDNDDETSDKIAVQDSVVDNGSYLKADMEYQGENTTLKAVLKFDQNTIKEHPEDILDEVYARSYLGNWVLEAGKMKMVWGKGDKLHVLDNFNANDYTDFIFPDYLERRIGEPMVSVSYNVPSDSSLRIQAVFTPMMTADRFASSGQWVPATLSALTDTVTNSVTSILSSYVEDLENARLLAAEISTLSAEYSANDTEAGTALTALITENASTLVKYGLDATSTATIFATLEDAVSAYLTAANTNYTTALMAASSISSDSSSLYPDTNTIEYAQAGLRITGTVGSTDLGASYYYGHYKQPTVNYGKMNTYLAKVLAGESTSDSDKFLDYDRLQVFGLEAARVFWLFNTRAEFAYNLTDDVAGDDPYVKNNSLAWVAGFDINLPIHNMNLNVQETGTYVLKNGEIENALDADYNSDDKYCHNKLVINLSDNFLYEKLKVECTGIWGIENKEFVIQPKVEYNIHEGFYLALTGGYVYSNNENGEFYNFTADNTTGHDKAFVEASVRCQF
ncbi:MAG: hypothetical protein K6F69_10450 [Treponema sp.]|nr:hypothetical protein [Treponema sp.]